MTEKVKVIYVAGLGRSGSTILGMLLGQINNVFSAGELSWIWSRGLISNEPCGCGQAFLECPQWKRIFRDGFGDISNVDAQGITDIWKESIPTRKLASYILHSESWLRQPSVQGYLNELERLYQSIASSTKCNYIVDASKSPAYAYLLSQLSDIALYIIHLVRDPRAVAFSWQRKKVRPEDGQLMIRHGFAYSALIWLAQNLFLEIVRTRIARNGGYVRIRYEDFVEDPNKIVRNLSDFIPDFPSRDFRYETINPIRAIHSVSGNPVRFQGKNIRIKIDDEWIRSMKPIHRLTVSTITLPLLAKYSYPII
jgi:hypothetical protein